LLNIVVMWGIAILASLCVAMNPGIRIYAITSPLTYVDQAMTTLRAVLVTVLSLIVYELVAHEVRTGVFAFWISIGVGIRRYVARKIVEIWIYALALVIMMTIAIPYRDLKLVLVSQLIGDVATLLLFSLILSFVIPRVEVVVLGSIAASLSLRSLVPAMLSNKMSFLTVVFSPWLSFYSGFRDLATLIIVGILYSITISIAAYLLVLNTLSRGDRL